MGTFMLVAFLASTGIISVYMQHVPENACDFNNPCGVHGKCEIYNGQPRCRCELNWTGRYCKQFCNIICSQYRGTKCAVKFPENNNPKCVCEQSEFKLLPVIWHENRHYEVCVSANHRCFQDESYCKNNGTCTDNGKYGLTAWCECPEGYYGRHCELNCERDICNNQPNTECQLDGHDYEANYAECVCKYKYVPVGSASEIPQFGCKPRRSRL